MDTDKRFNIEKMRKAQDNLLGFLENDKNTEENFQKIINFLIDFKIQEDQLELKEFLHLLFKILNNHQRLPNFFPKIERVVQFIKEDMKKFFSNNEIFNIFKYNKRILLFLFEEKIIEFDEYILGKFLKNKKFDKYGYLSYFQLEIQNLKEKSKTAQEKTSLEKLPKDFCENRRIGENNGQICQIIRKDDIKEFIIYINQNNFPLDSFIDPSIYETNSFLIKMQENHDIDLIEYAAFFGSIQIFTYLQKEGVKLTPSLWKFAIHGSNAELIHILEDNNIKPKNSFFKIFKEAIKCHHNSIANYLEINDFEKNDLKEFSENNVIIKSLKYHNYAFIKEKCIDQSYMVYLCEYDYPTIVKMLFETSTKFKIKI